MVSFSKGLTPYTPVGTVTEVNLKGYILTTTVLPAMATLATISPQNLPVP